MPVGWLIRRASPADLEAILAIEQACDEAPHWSRPSWLEALSEGEGNEPTRASFLAEGNSGIIGFSVVSCTGELAELESIAVSKPARCQGIGKALCRQGMDWSRDLGAAVIELEVRASSDGALALYRLLGFVEQGRRRGYYRNPAEDAVLMAAALQS
jgi:[ribosomal protein S18]-alanine N-acetyltransferase